MDQKKNEQRAKFSAISCAITSLSMLFAYSKIYQQKQKQQKLREEHIYRPEELLRKIENQDDMIIKRFTPIPEKREIIGKNMILQGIIQSEDPIKSKILSKNHKLDPNLIYLFSFDKKIYSNQLLFDVDLQVNSYDVFMKQKLLKNKKLEYLTEFSLADPMDTKKKATVSQYGNSNILEHCFDHRISMSVEKKLTTWENIKMVLLGISSLSFYVFSKLFSNAIIKGIHVSTECHEIGIKTGSILSMMGDIIYNYNDKTIRLINPIYLMKDKKGLLDQIRKGEQKYKQLLIFFGVLLCGFGYQLYDSKNNLKKIRKKNDKINDTKHLIPLSKIYKDPKEEMRCVICCERVKSVVYKPCLHLCTCKECYELLPEEKQCPICRKSITDMVPIYVQ